MFFHTSLTVFIHFLDLTFVSSIRKCHGEVCPDDLVCCKPQNTTHTACCRQVVDQTFYSIGVVTRKLSGILILLLLFTLGYVFHRLLCARARTQTPSHQQGLQTITASQELLVDSCTPDIDGSIDLLPQLPTYDECKQLPTYEETVRDGGRESGTIQPGCYMDTSAIYNNQQRKVFQSPCDVRL